MNEPLSPEPPASGPPSVGHDARSGRVTTAWIVPVLLLLIIGTLLTLARYQPPRPLSADVSPRRFSAMRAWEYLERVAGDGISRPTGSEQNAVVAGRIAGALQEMGYVPEVQEARVERRGREYPVRNIMAFRTGSDPDPQRPIVVLLSHYDSVPAGPGASDAGVEVAAILEVARMLSQEPAGRNDLLFLLTDGEENGMLGARAFVEQHPAAPRVAMVINLDARGTHGPSIMFETGEGNAGLIALMAAVIRRPVANSLTYEIYHRMPNDTDFTVFRRAGAGGYNFAFIRGVEHYHTATDDLEHASPASLQHQGENALALVRALINAHLSRPAGRDAVYFDFLSGFLVWWPAGLTVPMAAVTLLLLGVLISLVMRWPHVGGGWVSASVGFALVAVAISYVAARGFTALVRAVGLLEGSRPTCPIAVLAGTFLAALAGSWLVALACAKLVRRPRAWEGWLGLWIVWAIVALELALQLRGASYLALVPAMAATLIGFVAVFRWRDRAQGMAHRVAFASMVLPVLLWLPVEAFLYDATGLEPLAFLSLRAALLTSLAAPLVLPAAVPEPGNATGAPAGTGTPVGMEGSPEGRAY